MRIHYSSKGFATALLFSLAGNFLFSQCTVQAPADVTIPCTGSTTIAATTSFVTYSVTSTLCSPVAITGTNAFPTACDDCVTGQINIGFPFNFYGNPYTTAVIQSNGLVGFGPFTFTGYSSFAIPAGGAPNNYIAGVFGDIDIRYGGTITYQTVGVAPNRRFVVSYNNVVPYNSGSSAGTGTASFQIILNEDGSFNVVVSQLSAGWNASTSGVLLTSGAENIDGTYAFPVPGRNATDWPGITSGQQDCNLFNPAPCIFQRWEVGGVTVSTNASYNVTPATTTNYTAVWNCGGNTCTDGTLVTVSSPPVTTAGSMCSGGTAATMTSTSCGTGGTPVSAGATFNSGTLAATDGTWNRASTGTTCNGTAGTSQYYDAFPFTVTTTGSYSLAGCFPAIDGHASLYQNAFSAADPCGTPSNFIIADDDGNSGACDNDPVLTATLTAGVTYYIISTSFSATTTDSYSWTFTGPGQLIPGSSGTVQWYTAATGGTLIGSGSPFNPIGVAGSGIASSTSTGNYTFYAQCTSSPGCRTATSYVISPSSTAPSSVTGGTTICNGMSANLGITGGALATGAQWQWYSGSCGGTPVGTGSTITVTPSATTTYFVQATSGSGCPATACASGTVTLPTAGTTLANNLDAATCLVNQNGYVHFYHSSGRLIASINSNGQNLGNVTATAYTGAPVVVNSCASTGYYVTALGRRWVITPQFQPASAVTISLPYDNGEFTTLQTTANGNTSPWDNLASTSDLRLSKYSGPANVDNNAANNCPALGGNGGTTIHTQTASGNVSTLLPGFSATGRFSRFNIPSFSEFWLHGSSLGSPLPVELTSFSVSCAANNEAKIAWTTESETNCHSYSVERSDNGSTWTEIANVSCTGEGNYSVTDANRLNGISYYRLRQTDQNGAFDVYEPVSLSCSSSGIVIVAYPNPAADKLTVQLSSPDDKGEVMVELTDVTGKIIQSRRTELNAGQTNLPYNTEALSAGTYYISIRSSEERINPVKVFIQH